MKYTILSINDRAKDNIENTRSILSEYEELKVKGVNGHTDPIHNIMKELSIHKNNWKWVPPLKGEIGVWLSNILFLKKMIDEDIDECLLFEDDAILSENFLLIFKNLLEELPKDYHFLTLTFPISSNYLYQEDAEIGLKNICLARYNHFGNYAFLWSKSGAERMISLVKETGMTYPIDMYIFHELSRNNLINGYSVKPNSDRIISHDWDKYKSTIDLDGNRGRLDV